jgi:dihydroneopterin aldolase/2-amino-4-hydroxy-6-hydroxymethyldihydropteridine diphosphokinase
MDLSPAAASDALADTVHYGELAMALHAIVTGEPVDLIETLVQRLAIASLADPRVSAATLTVHKPHAPIPLGFDDVSVTVRRERKRAVLSLGSNLGDRLEHLAAGLDVLRARVAVTAVSPVYETAPVGGPEQGAYLNVVVLAGVPDGPSALAAAQAAEQAEHRERGVRFGPRTLDVDVITVAGELSDDPVLTLPHPRAHERAFVLAPWFDLAPDDDVAGHGPIASLLRARLAAGDDVTRRDNVVLR